MANSKNNDSNSSKTSLPEDIKHYYELMASQDLAELEIRDQDFYLKLSRQSSALPAPAVSTVPVAAVAPESASIPEEEEEVSEAESDSSYVTITSPLAGIFYRSPSPASDSFVKEGDKAVYGDILCIVEAMKVMNEIHADRPCVIRKILVENGKPVSSGQDLFLVEPTS